MGLCTRRPGERIVIGKLGTEYRKRFSDRLSHPLIFLDGTRRCALSLSPNHQPRVLERYSAQLLMREALGTLRTPHALVHVKLLPHPRAPRQAVLWLPVTRRLGYPIEQGTCG